MFSKLVGECEVMFYVGVGYGAKNKCGGKKRNIGHGRFTVLVWKLTTVVMMNVDKGSLDKKSVLFR